MNINFECSGCSNRTLSFTNRCHLKLHVLGHAERDGVNSVTSNVLHVEPLAEQDLNLGFVDRSYAAELDDVHEEIAKSKENNVQCFECRLTLKKSELSDHLKAADSIEAARECSTCAMVLPNSCSLSAHLRIHEKAKPHICPECAETFDTWNMFQVQNFITSIRRLLIA